MTSRPNPIARSVFAFALGLSSSVSALAQSQPSQSSPVVYEVEDILKVIQVGPSTFIHRSSLETEGWGRVACNGMIAIHNHHAVIVDTPASDDGTKELINWLQRTKSVAIDAIVVTHSHGDSAGGLDWFHSAKVPSFGSALTTSKLKAQRAARPRFSFQKSMTLSIGDPADSLDLHLFFPGGGHTDDNVVAYLDGDNSLFGGCLVKALGGGKGNLADADIEAWPGSIRAVQAAFPDAQIVIPGHGKAGGKALLERTIRIFEKDESRAAPPRDQSVKK